MNLIGMLAESSNTMGVRMVMLNNNNSNAGMDNFHRLRLRKKKIFGEYSEMSFYQILYKRQHNDELVQERALSLRVIDFYTCFAHISERVESSKGYLCSA